jgi:hypothetical protein
VEFPNGPLPVIEAGALVNYTFRVSAGAAPCQWKLCQGRWPEGLQFRDGVLSGATEDVGVFPVLLEVAQEGRAIRREFNLVARGWNLAADALRILTNTQPVRPATIDSMYITVGRSLFTGEIAAIRDGRRTGDGTTFYSVEGGEGPKIDWYGYEWAEPQEVGLLAYHNGSVEETGGWFRSLNVEYRDSRGYWHPVNNLRTWPRLPVDAEPYDKAHFVEYLIAFAPVTTTAIRMAGEAGSQAPWTGQQRYFTSITELGAYGPIPGIDKIMP